MQLAKNSSPLETCIAICSDGIVVKGMAFTKVSTRLAEKQSVVNKLEL